MTLIIDTHALIWFGNGHPKFGKRARVAIETPGTALFVSAVTAWEYVDLWQRGRIPEAAHFGDLLDMMDFTLLDFPGNAWSLASGLPPIHRDPVDRMLIAHAIAADLILVTADKAMRRYPVKSLW